MKKLLISIILLVSVLRIGFAQEFICGADLSYVNTIIENGGTYRTASGEIVDPFDYFATRGANMIRLRLWHTPQNITDHCGNPISSSGLADVISAAQKIKSNDMDLMLAIHYGDYFNDPGKQLRPAAWAGLDHQALLDSVYQYSYTVVEQLHLAGACPAIVGIGNETTNGFIDESVPTNGFSWPEDADKFNAGFNAIDDFNIDYNQNIQKAIHLTEGTAIWASALFKNNGITNYDIIGISFYPVFSPDVSLEEVGHMVDQVQNNNNKEVMIFETGFIWTTQNGDGYGNFVGNNGNTLNYPLSPQGQKDFLLDLAKVVNKNNGTGVFYWEPGWISSDMCDLWGQGSSYENASFFDFSNQNSALPAFDFFNFSDTLSVNNNTNYPIEIYPNPVSNGEFRIISTLPVLQWEIFNLHGQIVLTRQSSGSDQSLKVNIQKWDSGIYFLHYTVSNGKTGIRKLVIQN